MKIGKRVTVLAATAAVVVAGLGIGAAHAAGAGSSDGASAHREPAAIPSPESSVAPAQTSEPAAPPATPVPSINGSSGDIEGIPYYDADSDTSLIQYPTDLPADDLAHAQSWVRMMSLTADCMEAEGHPFQYTLWWDHPAPGDPRLVRLRESRAEHGTPAYEALYGDPFAPDYDPQAGAGCDGQARARSGDPTAYAN